MSFLTDPMGGRDLFGFSTKRRDDGAASRIEPALAHEHATQDLETRELVLKFEERYAELAPAGEPNEVDASREADPFGQFPEFELPETKPDAQQAAQKADQIRRSAPAHATHAPAARAQSDSTPLEERQQARSFQRPLQSREPDIPPRAQRTSGRRTTRIACTAAVIALLLGGLLGYFAAGGALPFQVAGIAAEDTASTHLRLDYDLSKR